MNEDKLLVLLARAHAGFFFGCRQFDLLLYYRISVAVVGVCYYYYCGTHNTTVAALNHYLPTH